MIKLNRDYSDYTDLDDEKYPNGKAIDCSTDESYDGTPIKKELINDLHGALEAVVKEAEGDISGVSGQPDNIEESDFKNAIKKLIDTPLNEHISKRGPDAHGATVAATPGQIITRDDNGRAQVADPAADDDIANKGWVEQITGLLSSLATTVKTNIVAALNEVRSSLVTHIGKTDNPHSVTKAQVGLGNCDNTADANKTVSKANTLNTARNIDGMSFNGSSNIVHFGTCSTAAGTAAKTVAITGFTLAAGSRISVKFTNGNTAGTAKGTSSNVIAVSSAPTLNVNSTGAKTIYVGGEPAGEGFINSGDVHDFVYDGTNWCDVTADVIYKGGNDTDGYYEKKRNGLIVQRKISKTDTPDWYYPIRYSYEPNIIYTKYGNSYTGEIYVIKTYPTTTMCHISAAYACYGTLVAIGE